MVTAESPILSERHGQNAVTQREIEHALHEIVLAMEYQQKRRFWQPDYTPVVIVRLRRLVCLIFPRKE